MSYTSADLSYEYSALESHDQAENLQVHDASTSPCTSRANATIEALGEATAAGNYASLVDLEETLAFTVSGHVLHPMFWKNLTPAGGRPRGDLAAAIDEHFGTLDAFAAQLSEAAVLVQGSGWGWQPLPIESQVMPVRTFSCASTCDVNLNRTYAYPSRKYLVTGRFAGDLLPT